MSANRGGSQLVGATLYLEGEMECGLMGHPINGHCRGSSACRKRANRGSAACSVRLTTEAPSRIEDRLRFSSLYRGQCAQPRLGRAKPVLISRDHLIALANSADANSPLS